MRRKLFSIIIIIGAVGSIAVLTGLGLKKQKASSSDIQAENKASLQSLLLQAKELETKNNFLEAKKIYQALINDYPNSGEVMNWQKKIEDINIKLLFSGQLTPNSAYYEIKPGDTVTKIANKFKTTAELIKKSNNLSDNISPGRKIKVWTEPFSIVVDKSQNTLILKAKEEIIKTYIVSTGKNNCTPVGTFRIANKLTNPTWFKAGKVIPAGSPENILGARWLGFDIAGYGIHGTTEPQNLGKQVTEGCVRMSNSDVQELYAIVPVGTEVTIVD
jgi:lipoprotein-anchoring transpeptidase ErfK/SrfK